MEQIELWIGFPSLVELLQRFSESCLYRKAYFELAIKKTNSVRSGNSLVVFVKALNSLSPAFLFFFGHT